MMAPSFKRLIRFSNLSREVFYGELGSERDWNEDLIGITIPVYNGQEPWAESFSLTDRVEAIDQVWCNDLSK